MPPLAASKRPGRSATAPENAPLAWPNSSLSASDSGRAAQFTHQRLGAAARQPARGARTVPCPRRSRPAAGWAVPESATTSISCSRRAMGSLWPRISWLSAGVPSARDWLRVRRSARVSASSRVVRSAASTSMISSRNSDWASAPKVPTSSASSVSTPQGWPSTCRLVPMQSCTGRLAGHAVDQAIVRVGQGAVVMEAGDAPTRQDGGQPGMLLHREAPAQRVLGQAVHGHGAQMVFLQLQQGHGAAGSARARWRRAVADARRGRSTTRSARSRFCMAG